MVGVYILTQEGNLPDTLTLQSFDLFQNGVETATPFPSSYERYNAEGTHIIAAAHDTQKSGNILNIFTHWCNISVGLINTQLHIHAMLLIEG